MIKLFGVSGYPKIRGKACLNCAYREPCYETYGWKTRFKIKEVRKGGYKLSSEKSKSR